jgi:hypothetical protein
MARAMASALNPENEQASKISKPSTSTPTQRKRRKRATGNNGAADDCFTCASRKTKCDRRRPYCTQCLNLGRNCSGYKTTLTWGVGVASRGKLRGFSKPVSDGQEDAARDGSQDQPKPTIAVEGRREQQPPGQPSRGVPVEQNSFGDFRGFQPARNGALQASNTLHRNVASVPPGSQVDSQVDAFPAQPNTSVPRYQGNFSGEQRTLIAPPSLTRPISTSTQVPYPYNESITSSPASHIQSNQFQAGYIPWSHVPNSTSGPSHQPQPQAVNRGYDNADDEDVEEIPYNAEASRVEQINPQYQYSEDSWISAGSSAPIISQLALTQPIGQTPRLRYLISYYAEVISPVIVAFDSPSNPYRTHILHLAQESKTLQHAIAALSASNLRQRREGNIISSGRTLPARKSSLAHSAMTDSSLQAQFGLSGPGNDVKEESFHQRAAIQSLNAQLADPARRRADSVLATLLILSLFHICDSGVASFQTQFAGVKKLLSLRGTALRATSEESKWFTKMFTFFDVLTATTNDREGQLQGIYLEQATVPDDQWPLENLVGCDGRLFKIVSRLNHLNVLSQNKPDAENPVADQSAPCVPLPPSMTHFGAHPQHSQQISDSYCYTSTKAVHADPDSRTEFWKEWRSIRQSLESWRLDAEAAPYSSSSPSTSDSSSSSSNSPPPYPSSQYSTPPFSPISSAQVDPDNVLDLSNISEAFRYSALLYTERLADPHLPSSHPLIQNLVLTSLHYIYAVRSDVFLLWPLFVTGTECVFESQRAVIRQRCQGIQKDSGFFNNISCLELLEKIWRKTDEAGNTNPFPFGNAGDAGTDTSKSLVPGGQAFRWRTVMDEEGLEGEYIVV